MFVDMQHLESFCIELEHSRLHTPKLLCTASLFVMLQYSNSTRTTSERSKLGPRPEYLKRAKLLIIHTYTLITSHNIYTIHKHIDIIIIILLYKTANNSLRLQPMQVSLCGPAPAEGCSVDLPKEVRHGYM